MKIKTFEKKTGLPRDTIRYYEDIGLLPPPSRSENGYRIYTDVHLRAIRFIEKGKAIGFSLKAIKEGYQRYQSLGHLCPEFTQQLLMKKQFFEDRIRDDKQTLADISQMLESGTELT